MGREWILSFCFTVLGVVEVWSNPRRKQPLKTLETMLGLGNLRFHFCCRFVGLHLHHEFLDPKMCVSIIFNTKSPVIPLQGILPILLGDILIEVFPTFLENFTTLISTLVATSKGCTGWPTWIGRIFRDMFRWNKRSRFPQTLHCRPIILLHRLWSLAFPALTSRGSNLAIMIFWGTTSTLWCNLFTRGICTDRWLWDLGFVNCHFSNISRCKSFPPGNSILEGLLLWKDKFLDIRLTGWKSQVFMSRTLNLWIWNDEFLLNWRTWNSKIYFKELQRYGWWKNPAPLLA